MYRPVEGQNDGTDDLRGFEWHYWDRLCHCDLLTLKAHDLLPMDVAYSPDGKLIATASMDKTAKIWDANTGSLVLTLVGHSETVGCVAFSPNGRWIATAGADFEVKLWEISSGKLVRTIRCLDAIQANTRIYDERLVFSPDGRFIANLGVNNSVVLWDAHSGDKRLVLEGHSDCVTSLAFSPNGRRLATASLDTTVKVWDVISGQETLTLKGHEGPVESVTYNPDGKHLVAATQSTLTVWNEDLKSVAMKITDPTASIKELAFDPKGEYFVNSTRDSIQIRDSSTGRVTLNLIGHTGLISGMSISPTGTSIATSSFDGTIKVWATNVSQESLIVSLKNGGIRCISRSSDGRWMAAGVDDGDVRVLDASTGVEVVRFEADTRAIICSSFKPDGSAFLCAGEDGRVRTWRTSDWTEQAPSIVCGSPVASIAFSSDGRWFATAGRDSDISVFDAKTNEKLCVYVGHQGSVLSVAFSPDNRFLASSSAIGEVKIWDMTSRREWQSLQVGSAPISDVVVSPDGTMVATAGHDSAITCWDILTGNKLKTFFGHSAFLRYSDGVLSMSFSQDGKRLVSGGLDRTVRVWDVATGTEVLSLDGNLGPVADVAFSGDGTRIVSAGWDGTIRLWDSKPWSTEMRVEHEAIGVVSQMARRGLTMSSIFNALAEDNTIPRPVLQRAQEIALLKVDFEKGRVNPKVASALELMSLNGLDDFSLAFLSADEKVSKVDFSNGFRTSIPLPELSPRSVISRSFSGFMVLSQGPLLFTLFDVSSDSLGHPLYARTFPKSLLDLAINQVDGRYAVCRRNTSGNPEIVISQSEGEGEENLGFGYDPIWSADGQKLFYTGSDVEDPWFIAVRAGAEKQRVRIPWHPDAHLYPCPSVDGKNLSFSMKGEDGTMQIGVVSLIDNVVRQVTRSGSFNTRASFSPDGQYIAFTRGASSPVSVVIVEVETGKEFVISNYGYPARPVWIRSEAPTTP